ncbi:hypothetical protein WMF27_32525 [Sorangium sp. So ce281]|uniref:hypothetical protein n=1 Tax=unclassified Sorangium TaxID=2621164 RepID=UPI003F5F9053
MIGSVHRSPPAPTPIWAALAFAGGTAPSAMVPFVTAAPKNWAEGTPVTVTDATLPMALEAMSVTTFVSQ